MKPSRFNGNNFCHLAKVEPIFKDLMIEPRLCDAQKAWRNEMNLIWWIELAKFGADDNPTCLEDNEENGGELFSKMYYNRPSCPCIVT